MKTGFYKEYRLKTRIREKTENMPWLRFIFICLFALGLTAWVLYLQPNSMGEIIFLARQGSYLMPLLNFLPIFFVSLILYYLSANMYVATNLSYLFFSIFSIVNRYKILFRDDPVVPADLKLGKEAINITKGNSYNVDYQLILYLFIILVFMNLAIYLLCFVKPSKKLRLIMPVLSLIILGALFNPLYQSSSIWDNLPLTESKYNLTANYNQKGVIYSFMHFMSMDEFKKPEHFDKKEMKEYIAAHKVEANSKSQKEKINVVMIMGEAYSDISRTGFFDFEKDNDPMKSYKELEKEALISGHIVVSSFGGGTANTEYDVLTGNVSSLLNDTTIVSFRTVRKAMPSIVGVFNEEGYHSIGIHPGETWFYNRKNVYEHFGFQQTIFKDDFIEPTYYANFMSEEDTTNTLMEVFKNRNKKTPLFEYCVTIQNHGAYPPEKYPEEKIDRNFSTKSPLSEEYKDIFATYFTGIRDMDEQIKTLTDYFKTLDEPVLFIYYGDHLPYLAPNRHGFIEMAYDINADDVESTERLYKTPYIIWANKKAKTLIDKEFLASLKDFDKKSINSSYLGAMVLGLLDLDEGNPYFHFLNNTRKDLPIAQRELACIRDKSDFKLLYPNELQDAFKACYERYLNYIYYNVKYGE